MATVQLTGSKGYDMQMVIHSATYTADVNLAHELQKNLSNEAHKYEVNDKGK